MEIILTQDVERLGKQGAVVKVKPGFARNFLVPKGLAMEATAETKRTIEEIARQQSRKVQREQKEHEAAKRRIESQPLTLTLTFGENETAFGSVTANDLADALKQAGHTVEKSMIKLSEPIKTLGEHTVPVRLSSHVTATLTVRITKAE